MINITIVSKNTNILTIEATGHSGYADRGLDIVCSAISVLTENTINSLIKIIGIKPSYTINEDIPHLSVTLPSDLSIEKMKSSQIIMKSTMLGIKNVADSYPKHIKIKEIQHD